MHPSNPTPGSSDQFKPLQARPGLSGPLNAKRPTAGAPASRANLGKSGSGLGRRPGGLPITLAPQETGSSQMPIEASPFLRDEEGVLHTPALDGWLAGSGASPRAPREIASELCGLTETEPVYFSATLRRCAGEPIEELLRALSPIELKSFLRALPTAHRRELLQAWSQNLEARLGTPERLRRAAQQILVCSMALPRLFGVFQEILPARLLQRILESLPQEDRKRLRELTPAASSTPTQETLYGWWEDLLAESHTPSFRANVWKRRLGLELLEGGASSWKSFGVLLEQAMAAGGRSSARQVASAGLEGLREAALESSSADANALLQLPFSLSAKFQGIARAIFNVLGQTGAQDFMTLVQRPEQWKQLSERVMEAIGGSS